mgnify:FL=1
MLGVRANALRGDCGAVEKVLAVNEGIPPKAHAPGGLRDRESEVRLERNHHGGLDNGHVVSIAAWLVGENRGVSDSATPELPELPEALVAIREDFLALTVPDRLQLLLEFANGLPDLPERYADHPELLEPVPECQSPIAFFVEIEKAPDGEDHVHFFASAPPGAPTSRGFAGILGEGLAGLTTTQVLAIPADYPLTLGLAEAVSPLRLRGMTALLTRAKRQVAERTGTA